MKITTQKRIVRKSSAFATNGHAARSAEPDSYTVVDEASESKPLPADTSAHVPAVPKPLALLSLLSSADQVPAGLWMALPPPGDVCPVTGAVREHLETLVNQIPPAIERIQLFDSGGAIMRLFNVRSYMQFMLEGEK